MMLFLWLHLLERSHSPARWGSWFGCESVCCWGQMSLRVFCLMLFDIQNFLWETTHDNGMCLASSVGVMTADRLSLLCQGGGTPLGLTSAQASYPAHSESDLSHRSEYSPYHVPQGKVTTASQQQQQQQPQQNRYRQQQRVFVCYDIIQQVEWMWEFTFTLAHASSQTRATCNCFLQSSQTLIIITW